MIRDMWTIFRRELATYFNSTIGYIFIVAFLGLNGVMFMLGFLQYPVAEMRMMFDILPAVLCVFVPAITMRLWAEDRSGNTLELLLTFPMKPVSIVLGKYFASLAFLILALAGTLTIPLMLGSLGDPDGGQIFSSYVGAFLLGASFLAMGLFLSGLVKDQIVAFVLALTACIAVFLLSWGLVAAAIDDYIPGLGGNLQKVVGATGHYYVFTKGIIEATGIVFFVVWTVVFLVLNGMFMELRGRRSAKATFTLAVVLCLAIGMLFNALIADSSLGRFDFTEGRVHTVSEGSAKILSELKVPVQVKYYVTPSCEMPTELKSIERDVLDKLQEMRLVSGGKLEFKPIHMRAANVLAKTAPADEDSNDEKSEEHSLEERMLDKGVQPFSISARRQTGTISEMVYSCIGVAYKEKSEEIIPQITPARLADLEYSLVSTIYRLTREKPATVAMVAPVEQIPPVVAMQYRRMGRPVPPPRDYYETVQRLLMQEKYQVLRIAFNKNEPLPPEYDALVVINPQELNERQRWEIARALAQGGKVFLAVQNYTWKYDLKRGRLDISRQDVNPQINELLKEYGVSVDEKILMDSNAAEIRISRNQLEQMFGGGASVKLPTHLMLKRESFNLDDPLTSRLGTLLYTWGTAIKLNEDTLKKHGLQATTLISTSEQAWTIPPVKSLLRKDVQPPLADLKAYPIAVRIKGQFPDVYKEKKRPEWPDDSKMSGRPPMPPPPDPPAGPLKPAEGELILVGCAQMYHRNALSQGSWGLLLNSVDSLALSDDLVGVRSNKQFDRSISEAKVSAATRVVWSFVNCVLVGLVLIGIGVTRSIMRLGARARYAAGITTTT